MIKNPILLFSDGHMHALNMTRNRILWPQKATIPQPNTLPDSSIVALYLQKGA